MRLLFDITFYFTQIPEVKNYEDIGLKSILIFLVIALLAAIVFLYKSKETRIQQISESYKDILHKQSEKHNTRLKEQYHNHLAIVKEKDVEIRQLHDARVAEGQSYITKYEGVTEKMFNHFQRSTEFFKSLKDG